MSRQQDVQLENERSAHDPAAIEPVGQICQTDDILHRLDRSRPDDYLPRLLPILHFGVLALAQDCHHGFPWMFGAYGLYYVG